ncbi:MAG: alpha/beta hydrolase [Bacteriovoracaceae bacterium]|nr:alpha/beta hydrolase [Bacteriovoracaceae bacterium]
MTKQKHFYLIRGLIREKAHWGNFLDHLQATFPNAKLTPIDIPGAGDYHSTASPLSVSGMVEVMRRDYLKAKLAEEDAHFIAVSLGGMIAVEWMKKYPTDFSGGTLINTSMGGISPFHHRLIPEALLFLLRVPFLQGRGKESHILKLVTNHQETFGENLDLWDSIQKERPVSFENSLRQLFAAGTFRPGQFIPPLPLHLLASTNDRMVSVECSRAIAKKWHTPIEEHPTGGHDLTSDDPKWVADRIKDFIES